MKYRIVETTLENGDIRYVVEERHHFLRWHWWSVAKIDCIEYEHSAIFYNLTAAKEFIRSRMINEVKREVIYEA